MSEFWMKWEGEVVNGLFPLRRFLGSSTHSAVFLTEDRLHQLADAAIKFIRADPPSTELELGRWRAAAAVSHPHLVRLFEAGECRLGSYHLLFVVMDYSEQTLGQVLKHRALTFDEVRQMLRPLCDAVAFLHRDGWVHRQIKPANVCVVNDEVKLAGDTIRRAGETPAGAERSRYDPPEAKHGKISTAGDVWSLGMTVVAALTGQAVARRGAPSETLSLPASVPPAFADMLERCLSREPSRRPTITEIQALVEEPGMAGPVGQPAVVEAVVPEARIPEAPVPIGPIPAAPVPEAPVPEAPRLWPGLAVGGIILLSVAVWGGMHLMRAHDRIDDAGAEPKSPARVVAPPVPSPSTPSTPPVPSASNALPPAAAAASRGVLHKEVPVVPSGALRTVHGVIRVIVRVTVDPMGKVVDEAVRYPGSSKYFTRLAADAAKKWRFDRAPNQAAREWLLQFEFTRAGVDANAEPRS